MGVFFGLLAFVVFAFWMAMRMFKKQKREKIALKNEGYDKKLVIRVGKYMGGHPDIDKSFPIVEILPTSNDLTIYASPNNNVIVQKKAAISKQQIEDVSVQDASSMQSRLSIGAIALVGAFAFAMPKKKKLEMAYVIIKWNDGKFNHETIFEWEGTGAMQLANTARNALIKLLR